LASNGRAWLGDDAVLPRVSLRSGMVIAFRGDGWFLINELLNVPLHDFRWAVVCSTSRTSSEACAGGTGCFRSYQLLLLAPRRPSSRRTVAGLGAWVERSHGAGSTRNPAVAKIPVLPQNRDSPQIFGSTSVSQPGERDANSNQRRGDAFLGVWQSCQ